eukprot:CAMPEP_0173241346 /NCGR_PEP_ID=MMETSP1142-20121109/14331_1 /TAXON_ID=483371 /ORGANISM="non described non described, Strain CCMP2298" /LENGTH=127 /DNA_ID=CAMNT_0014172689 /DNA_START=237 /DNA_END=620 /DNA_ORIENTATION=+
MAATPAPAVVVAVVAVVVVAVAPVSVGYVLGGIAGRLHGRDLLRSPGHKALQPDVQQLLGSIHLPPRARDHDVLPYRAVLPALRVGDADVGAGLARQLRDVGAPAAHDPADLVERHWHGLLDHVGTV